MGLSFGDGHLEASCRLGLGHLLLGNAAFWPSRLAGHAALGWDGGRVGAEHGRGLGTHPGRAETVDAEMGRKKVEANIGEGEVVQF
jgi:hypothetical protein